MKQERKECFNPFCNRKARVTKVLQKDGVTKAISLCHLECGGYSNKHPGSVFN